ncbi:MAG TPA: hypothetical protein VGD17_08410 [Chitinophagaceae bacterium]
MISKLFVKSLLFTMLVCICSISYISCKRELSCEKCLDKNKPPIADAGPDQPILLPKDSTRLDGASSYDPDGKIIRYEWTTLRSPAAVSIVRNDSSITIVKKLAEGIYEFELKVTDDKGAHAKDTVIVVVGRTTAINLPPIARAGPDQIINLPINSAKLDGSASTDPDGNIVSYNWLQLSGPTASSITNANTDTTRVINLVQGAYVYELKVTDNGGLFSKDTILISVNPAFQNITCDGTARSEVPAQLVPVGTLSVTREGIAVAAASNKVVFAGGHAFGSVMISRVDIYNTANNSWSTAELTEGRTMIKTTVLGNKIYFAGGLANGLPSNTVDIYDAVANSWSAISVPGVPNRGPLIAVSAAGGKLICLRGTSISIPPNSTAYTFAEVYDITTNNWRTDTLYTRTQTSVAMSDDGIAATAVGNKIYFAGNASDWNGWDYGSITSTINIYDAGNNTWSSSDLMIARGFLAGVSDGTRTYWAGGVYKQPLDFFTDKVEIRDANGNTTSGCLFQPNGFIPAVQKNNHLVFFTSDILVPPTYFTTSPPVYNKFDIYDIPSNKWTIGVLPVNIYGSKIASVNNAIYVGGGFVNGVLSNQVWRLEY